MISTIAEPSTQKEGSDLLVLTTEPPTDEDEISQYYIELLQFKIIKDIRMIQWDHISSREFSEDGFTYFSVKKHEPFKLTKSENITPAIITELEKSKFYNSDMEKLSWKMKFTMPPGTRLRIDPIEKQKGKISGKVTFEKENFFSIQFEIQRISGAKVGRMPEGLKMNVSPERAKLFRTYAFSITGNASFNKYTSLHPSMEEYKKWTDWVFDELRTLYSFD